MVYAIKDTVDIYCFCKYLYEAAQEHLPQFQFETNREVPAFFFQNYLKADFLSWQKPLAS